MCITTSACSLPSYGTAPLPAHRTRCSHHYWSRHPAGFVHAVAVPHTGCKKVTRRSFLAMRIRKQAVCEFDAGRGRVETVRHSHHKQLRLQQQQQEQPATARRRRLLLAAAHVAALRQVPRSAAAAAEGAVLRVGPTREWRSIAAALQAAADGAMLLVDAGVYAEPLVFNRSVRVAPAVEGAVVELRLQTQQPYVHCLALTDGSRADALVVVEGLRLRHSSKSVANNYAAYVQAGTLVLRGCDVSSASGAGVAVEGGGLRMQGCRVHDCARHGVVVFAGLLEDGPPTTAELEGCSISGNKGHGILVKGGQLRLQQSEVVANGSSGVQLQDCGAVLVANSMRGNRGGSVTLEADSVEADVAGDNVLDVPMQLL